MTDKNPQTERFRETARELDCDESEERWDATLKYSAKQKPAPEHPEDQ